MKRVYGRITGWGKYAPKRILTNHELEAMVDTSDEWIVSRTGIRERHIAGPDEPTSMMSVRAGLDAMKVAGISAKNLDLIIVATSSPDYLLPPVSSQIQDKLGADCGAFSIVAGCTGWVYALTVAQQFIQSNAYKTILIIGAERISQNIDWTDRTTCVLFGDGAGAVVMQASETQTGVLAFELGSDGSGYEHLIVPGGGAVKPISQEIIDEREHWDAH
jgi:3-oxoacyl-[acyl-carrier-protein] synthase-3